MILFTWKENVVNLNCEQQFHHLAESRISNKGHSLGTHANSVPMAVENNTRIARLERIKPRTIGRMETRERYKSS